MPLQNRVKPDGEIVALPWRGTMMGNRGGRIHDPETQTLLPRRWASKRWICCVTRFNNRRRRVMSAGYTELFFLDEVTALSFGHRPCFECRRAAAVDFSNRWKQITGYKNTRTADEMDRFLHAERLSVKPMISFNTLTGLPDAACVKLENRFFMIREGQLLEWSGDGYKKNHPIELRFDQKFSLITPATILSVLEAGYSPVWHPTASG